MFRRHFIQATIAVTSLFIIPSIQSFAIVRAIPSTPPLKSQRDNSSNDPSQSLPTSTGPLNDSCLASDMTTVLRSVQRVLPRQSPHWVVTGFHVYPVFSHFAFTNDISPLLMFDYAEPRAFPPGSSDAPRGVGAHPHRGFATVTIAFQGEVQHHDHVGNSGVIRPGDVQWMTAGRGIVHEEYHSHKFTETGGTLEMCQLWVNLPKKDKMTPPSYQAIPSADIPTVHLPLGANEATALGTARVIAGEIGDTKGAARTFSPVQVWDVHLPQVGVELDIPFPAHHNCIIFLRRGSVEVMQANGSKQLLQPQEVALMVRDGVSNTVRIRVVDADSSILVLGGAPLDEPIAAQGPFVMNTPEEIQEAIFDYRSGKFTAE